MVDKIILHYFIYFNLLIKFCTILSRQLVDTTMIQNVNRVTKVTKNFTKMAQNQKSEMIYSLNIHKF